MGPQRVRPCRIAMWTYFPENTLILAAKTTRCAPCFSHCTCSDRLSSQVYPAIDWSEHDLANSIGEPQPEIQAAPLAVDTRCSQPRTAEDMEREARRLSILFW